MDDKKTSSAVAGCFSIIAYVAFAVFASFALGLLVSAWAGLALMALFALVGALVMRRACLKLNEDAKGEDDDRVA